ncbi:hypothetical protein AQUCO_00300007v1 [Aquilegia coerulea]|uniref:Uncharacterized protein n=1 Tax=Aquilegia coerulea TaxID=218851 RepID=A0A2G5EWU0_AQUCA|nr:hypothetical protein AQUCO_00300007v1 [Aquilegia coerulea]
MHNSLTCILRSKAPLTALRLYSKPKKLLPFFTLASGTSKSTNFTTLHSISTSFFFSISKCTRPVYCVTHIT